MSRRIFRFFTLIFLTAACLLSAGCETRTAAAANTPDAAPRGQVSAPEPTAAPVVHAAPDSTPPPSVPEDSPLPQASAPAQSPAAESSAPAKPAPSPEPMPLPEPPQVTESVPEPSGGAEADGGYTGPDLAHGEPVEDGFFSDAAFLGNSLVDGLSRYGGLDQGSFYAATSASVVNVDVTLNSLLESGDKGTLIEAMTEKSYEKIYILLGINEIGFEPDYFSQLYGAMLDRIRRAEPEADIYIMSLSPVTEECSEYSDVFNMERIGMYNDKLYALAGEKECYYVDLCQALAGEDGYLPEDDSTDGIHLKPEKYPAWAEYLRTHVK